jgi:hypothetical protein
MRMKLFRLELDHLRQPDRAARLSWVLLALALGFTADVGFDYFKTRSEIAVKTATLARLMDTPSLRNALAQQAARPASQEEYLAARDTIVRLSMPWSNIFGALDAARSDDVALLSIDPDPGPGSVTIVGEAKNYAAVLTYVAWLDYEKSLSDVRLAKHEFLQDDPRRPVRFSISASWKDGR